jgi:hypothetical protein
MPLLVQQWWVHRYILCYEADWTQIRPCHDHSACIPNGNVPAFIDRNGKAHWSAQLWIFISLNILIMSYGALVGYLVVLKDTLPILKGIHPSEWYHENCRHWLYGILIVGKQEGSHLMKLCNCLALKHLPLPVSIKSHFALSKLFCGMFSHASVGSNCAGRGETS